MQAWHFSENAYHLLPDAKEYDSIRVTLPNRYYDPKIGADLYHRYIDEWMIAEDVGLEIMVNEHHQTATNLNPAGPIIMGILARETKKARLRTLAIRSLIVVSRCVWLKRWQWLMFTHVAALRLGSYAGCRMRCPPGITAQPT